MFPLPSPKGDRDFDRPAMASSSKGQQPAYYPQYIGPVLVDNERLLVESVMTPPLDLKGYYHDGVEFYCCTLKDCMSAWAVQWVPIPRNKTISGNVSLATYKSLAVPKICDRCKQTIQISDRERLKKYEAYRAKMEEEHTAMAKKQEKELMEQRRTSMAEKEKKLKEMADAAAEKHFRAMEAASARHQKAQDKPPTVFEDVHLSPPHPVFEDPAVLAATDPSWDVVDEEDANEDWAIINHFGSVAIQHRDAHVDTLTVRP